MNLYRGRDAIYMHKSKWNHLKIYRKLNNERKSFQHIKPIPRIFSKHLEMFPSLPNKKK